MDNPKLNNQSKPCSSGLRTEARRLLEEWDEAQAWHGVQCEADARALLPKWNAAVSAFLKRGPEIIRALLAEGEPTEGQEKADGLRDVQPVLTQEPEATSRIRRECYLAGLILPDGEWSHE